MFITDIIFYTFASLAIISALVLVLSNNPVNSVIAMIFTFIFTAIIWIVLQQAYLALLLIVVYVGAVLVMFLFVVFMLDLNIEKQSIEKQSQIGKYIYTLLAIIVCSIFAIVIGYITINVFAEAKMKNGIGSIKLIGLTMFNDSNLYTFEIIDFILLTAMTSVITLTLRTKRRGNKAVDPSKQVKVRAKDRLTMLKITNDNNRELENE